MDGIPAELNKAGGPALTNEIHRLCAYIHVTALWTTPKHSIQYGTRGSGQSFIVLEYQKKTY